MTHDELVKFVASKLGGDLLPKLVNGHPYMRLWSAKDEDYDMVRVNLSSPDLMLKGMGVFQETAKKKFCAYAIGMNEVTICSLDRLVERSAKKKFEHVSEVPISFWTAWAEVEGGQG